MFDSFRQKEFNVLVSTSITEEGLDIPEVNLVIFYEPVSSGISHIQRKGRTGRRSSGNVIILAYKDTIDIRLLYASKRRVKKWEQFFNSIKTVLKPVPQPNPRKYDRISESESTDLDYYLIDKKAVLT